MYDNIGSKIKGLAKATFIVEAIGAIITGLVLLSIDDGNALTAVLLCIGGPVVAWVSSWLLYGFGELIDKACEIADNTSGKQPQSKKQEEAKTNYYEPSGKVKVIAKDDTFIDIICPHCGKQVSFASDTKSASCPWCNANINLQ